MLPRWAIFVVKWRGLDKKIITDQMTDLEGVLALSLHDDLMAALAPEEAAWNDYFKSFAAGGGEAGSLAPDRLAILSQFMRHTPVGVIIVSADDDGRVLFINTVASDMLDYDRDEDPEITWRELSARRIMRGPDDVALTAETDPVSVAKTCRSQTTSNVTFRDPDSDFEDWLSVTAFPIFTDVERSEMCAVVLNLIDLTDYKGMQDILYHQATHDQLTGLANRSSLSTALTKAIARSRRSALGGAVLFLEIDRLKHVNIELGHAAGDELLTKLGERLISEVRDTDVVSRIGGDEFILLLADIPADDVAHVAADVAARISASLTRPFVVHGGEQAEVSTSIGISTFPADSTDEDELISFADKAMYSAKEEGHKGWKFWSDLKH